MLGTTKELAAIRKDGIEIPIELSVSGMKLDTEWHAVAIVRDITERKRSEAKIIRMARYDPLTELANRGVFVEELQHAIARARRGGKTFAVLYLDLDHFKDVNDTLGHPVGDLLLQSVAERLRTSVRQTDIAARFGGDEFALIETDIQDPAEVAILADKVLKVISEPFFIQGNEIRIRRTQRHCSPTRTRLCTGPNRMGGEHTGSSPSPWTSRYGSGSRSARSFARGLPVASSFSFTSNRSILTPGEWSFEALVRWRHPTRGLLLPGEFIPAAEKSGLIVVLGLWVMREACRQARIWLDAGIGPPLIAVNVSGLQLKTPLELENNIAAILAETGLPAQLLELELTETVLMEASREHNDLLLRLRKAGLRIAVDDFGTGYSSLDYLRRFPVDRIKIAQSFILELTTAPSNAVIVKAAIGLARELNIDVVVEGVETAQQLDLITSWGCRTVQGYYFSKPLPAEEITAVLRGGVVLEQSMKADAGAH